MNEKMKLYYACSPHLLERLPTLYKGMARVKSHVIQNASKLGENHSLGLQNTLAIVYGQISSYTCSQRPHTHLQYSTREVAHTCHHNHLLLLRLFQTRSLPEQVAAMIFSLNVSRLHGGVHGHQAVVSSLSHVPTVDLLAPPW